MFFRRLVVLPYQILRGDKILKKICSLFLCFLMFLFGYGCSQPSKSSINILTSFYPTYIMVVNLVDGAEGVSVTNMAENHTGCLHDFQFQSSDMKKIETSDVFIINGAGMESFLDKAIKSNPRMKIIDSSEGIDLIISDHCHHDEDDDHGDICANPHVWVSITNYIKQVENICQGLSTIDPKNKEKYEENAYIYIKKLEDLRENMHLELDDLPNRDIVTFHEAFPYFAREFNLNVVSVISSQPHSEASVKEISENIELVKSKGIKAIFIEPQYSSTSAEAVANETGAKVYVLDSSSSGEVYKDAYVDTMKKNLTVLKEALA